MSLKSLIFFLFVATHAVNALYAEELLELSRVASNVDIDSVKDFLNEAIAEEIKSEIFSKKSSEKETEYESESETESSESRFEDSWLDLESEPSSVFDDPEENDALYSRDSINSHKRDEYYESLEKKSQRSTFIPPPRKNFYTTPEVLESSSSEEHFHEERPGHRRPNRILDQEDYFPERSHLADVMHSESHPLQDTLHLLPSRNMYQQRPTQIPPWRITSGRSYHRKQIPPAAPHVVEQRPRSPEPPHDPLVSKAAVHRTRGSYRKSSTAPRRPAPLPVPVHTTHMHGHDESKFKSLSRSKPWVTEYKKESTTPKFAAQDDSIYLPPVGLGKPIRQQFHEQGTRGPHSYKFGYSTGDKENPMARYEERDSDGIVRGSYSYIDPRGHKQVVHYESHPKFGFKTRTNPSF